MDAQTPPTVTATPTGSAAKTIAVTGATGRQGRSTVEHLLRRGFAVRALTRRPSRARALAEQGAEVVQADMDRPATLDAAFEGVHGVLSVQNAMTSSLDAELRQGRNVVDAAARAGVSHFVQASAGTGQRGTGVGQWEVKLDIEAYAKERGLPLTVGRPMAFMELMTDPSYYPASSTWHVMPMLMGPDRRIGWISAEDLGAIYAGFFADPERYVGADLTLMSDVRSLDECAALWKQVMGKARPRLPMPVFLFKLFVGDDLVKMWSWLRTGEVTLDTSTTRDLWPEARTVEAWLRERAAT